MKSYVIAISGSTGAGKSTLIKEIAAQLDASILYYDAYQSTVVYPANYMEKLSKGETLELSETKSPDFARDLMKLKSGEKVKDPWNREVLPNEYIIIEEPFGRLRNDIKDLIDFVAFIQIPLDVSLARRILRDIQKENAYKDLAADKKLEAIEGFLTNYVLGLGNAYKQVNETVSNTADITLDGLKETKDNAAKVLAMVKEHKTELYKFARRRYRCNEKR